MRFTIASAATLATLAATVSAQQTFQVQVGGTNGLVFSPNTVNASVGDTVEFVFLPKNHTVTQSSGVDSGFQPVAANATQVPSFSVTVNATTPLWFYCRQAGHCEQGMVFAVNPTANKSFEAFQATAKASSADGSPPSSSGAPSSAPSGTGSAGSSASSASGTHSSTSSGSSASSTSTSKPNGAVTISASAQAGGLLAAIGLAAGILL
ncbi:Cupredoxin [Multifurca ochricompacta]|uniref:Cupredoxin n=1 Tax=Multifurca ochricompacta TaxID=376703 RepID=A0AAD4LU15_9AGAM|nr:Cupredoxin [Multifurca ochricompacta]